MYTIEVSEKIKEKCPGFAGAAVTASVTNSMECEGLWKEIEEFSHLLQLSSSIADINKHPVIAATRDTYKRCGKDPGRYRPSAEALRRRILRNIPLYRINTLVDLINLVSLRTGFSIGGFDADKITGNRLVLGIGEAGEAFEGIGRGVLNIEGLPVYRDLKGGIGTPTSDHERSKLEIDTQRILVLINGYNGKEGLTEAAGMICGLLKKYAAATQEEIGYFP